MNRFSTKKREYFIRIRIEEGNEKKLRWNLFWREKLKTHAHTNTVKAGDRRIHASKECFCWQCWRSMLSVKHDLSAFFSFYLTFSGYAFMFFLYLSNKQDSFYIVKFDPKVFARAELYPTFFCWFFLLYDSIILKSHRMDFVSVVRMFVHLKNWAFYTIELSILILVRS